MTSPPPTAHSQAAAAGQQHFERALGVHAHFECVDWDMWQGDIRTPMHGRLWQRQWWQHEWCKDTSIRLPL